MKKSLVALAVLGAFAGTASAQSSVTIYGVVDMSLAKTNAKAVNPVTGASAYASNPGAPANDAYTLQQSTTSRLGFRGTEDMGGGLSAQFQIEHRFNPDTGNVNAPSLSKAQNEQVSTLSGGRARKDTEGSFWNGRSFVQLTQANVGSIYLGREYNPAFWVQLKSDPFGNDGVGQASVVATFAGYFPPDDQVNEYVNSVSARTSNTVGVKSASFGGLTFQGAVSLSEGIQQGRTMGFNVEYTSGPLYGGLGYEVVKDGTQDGTGLWNAAVHYDLGVAKLMGYYARSQTRTPGTVNGENTNHAWMLSASAPLGGGLVKAMYYKVDPRGANNTRTKLGLGYNYPLSKRTNLYADMGLASQDTVKKNNAFAFGVRHYF